MKIIAYILLFLPFFSSAMQNITKDKNPILLSATSEFLPAVSELLLRISEAQAKDRPSLCSEMTKMVDGIMEKTQYVSNLVDSLITKNREFRGILGDKTDILTVELNTKGTMDAARIDIFPKITALLQSISNEPLMIPREESRDQCMTILYHIKLLLNDEKSLWELTHKIGVKNTVLRERIRDCEVNSLLMSKDNINVLFEGSEKKFVKNFYRRFFFM